ncbi:MAG: hypothetical protein ACIAXF_02565 [Phycisphaerales bacterium JB063]
MMRTPLALTLLLALGTLTSCDNVVLWGDHQTRAMAKTPGFDLDPFKIGPASDWQEEKLYLDFVNSQDVALLSRHGMLVAIYLVNPDTGNTVIYDRTANLFRDPQDNSTYSIDGLIWGDSEGQYSLERCRIHHLGPLDDPHVELMVDRAKRFAYERQEWSKAASNHLYELAE